MLVYNGTYYENIIINKSISIIGEDKNTTIIDGGGSGDVIYFSANWINIKGFTLQNSGDNWGNACLDITSNYNSINDNVIKNDGSGLFGIYLHEISLENTITNNVVEGCIEDGIYLCKSSDNNTISENFFINNHDGIQLFGVYGNIISYNTVLNNNDDGISISNSSTDNSIYGNKVFNNSDIGIYIGGSSKNSIKGNNVSSNIGQGINLSYSSGNSIMENTIIKNEKGIIYEFSNNNSITVNDIRLNNYSGIQLIDSSNNNNIYHNNLINNAVNAVDECSNIWHNLVQEAGNYWDDYNGTDSDKDGIGDTPYNISGGDNQDSYPLMHVFGPPYAEFEYIIERATVEFNASKSGDYSGYIVTYEWDFDDGTIGIGKIVSHTYSNVGTYDVLLTVKDNTGNVGNVTKSAVIDEIHQPPNETTIDGSSYGQPGILYSFCIGLVDPNGDNIYCKWDWGDGTYSNWLGPYISNQTQSKDHGWIIIGTYEIRVKLKDEFGLETNWSEPFIIVIEDELPNVKITMPEKRTFYLNFKDRIIFQCHFLFIIIIGKTNIEVEASDEISGISKVEIYIDGELRYIDISEPYKWTWDEKSFFRHRITVIGYDNAGNQEITEIKVRKFF